VAWEAVVAGLIYRFRLKDAETEIGRWLARDPDSPPALLARGKLQEQRDESSEALQTYRRLVEIDPEHDQARMRMTTILIQLSQAGEALPHLDYLRARLPHHPELMVQSAQALDVLGRADEARATLDDCLRHHPDHATALLERGRIARRDGDAAFAEECLGRAVRLDPGNVPARYHYSLVLTSNGKQAEAAKEEAAVQRIQADVQRIKDLLQQRADDPSAFHEVALIAMRAGRPKEALRWLLEGLRVDPDHAPTHRTLAALYHELGHPILSSRHRAIAQRLGGNK
jgi:predicted Zn-dependent protease